jgi:hypothetical protein
MSLSTLPNELLVQILEGIASGYNEQCKIFGAIARVNRHLHSIITPLLYRNFEDCCAKHLRQFGRTVFTMPRHGELVKQYTGRHGRRFDSSGCPMAWNVFALDEDLEKLIKKRLPDLPSPTTPSVFSHALACILPDVQSLVVTNGGNLFMRQLSSPSSLAIAPFQQLHSLRLDTEPDRTYGLQDISLVFMLPSLSTLTIDMAALNTREEQNSTPVETIWHCPPRWSTIRELTLERCGLPATWTAAMIASCQTLRHFHQENYYWDTNAQYYMTIYQALQCHRESLDYVRMNELNGCKVDAALQTDPTTPIPFQHFTSLTHLDMPLFTFATRTHHCPIDYLLPPSLRVLTVDVRSSREGPCDSFFISLAEAAQSHLPRLKSVELICRIEEYRDDGYLPVHFCHLRRMFSTCGIDLSYFLEFVQCEFKAGECLVISYSPHLLTTFSAYMASLLATMRASGPDGCEMADHSSLEAGCLSRTYPFDFCNSRSPNASRAKRNWGYIKDWTGPSEFELLS